MPKTMIDELTWNWWEDGRLIRQEIGKQILSNHYGWIKIAFLYREMVRATGKWKEPRVAIVRYRRLKGTLRRQGPSCNLNANQFYVLMRTAEEWLRAQSDAAVSGFDITSGNDASLVPLSPPVDPESLEPPSDFGGASEPVASAPPAS